MKDLYDTNLVQWLQLSGEYMVEMRPVEERGLWVQFFLREIEAHVPAEEIAALLAEVRSVLNHRLQYGAWPEE